MSLSPPAGPLLAARELGRQSPASQTWLLRNISLELTAGDRVALVGATGSGKSLVLRALALLDPVDQGEVLWMGKSINDSLVPEFRSHVLYLQQRSPVSEGTVEDNLKVPFSLRQRSESSFPRERATRLLASLGRDEGFLASRTANLSGGERQIVALLRALLVDPTVLLLDEPSAALDPEATSALEGLVDSWFTGAPAERAYFWVSHDRGQAERVADRIVLIRDGRVEATE